MSPNRWDDALLNEMRGHGDPPADAIVAEIIGRDGIARVDQLLDSLIRNDDVVPAEMPARVRDYLYQSGTLPTWADPAQIALGERFFNLHWPLVVTLLFCASLPNAYSAWRGAQVLWLTKRLTGRVHRRIFETAQFILYAMAPDGLAPEGRGIRAAQKVRLMHAAMRHYILHKPEWRAEWNMEWGVPINQEDLAGTLMTFSIQILVGMKRFRIPMEPAHEEAYLHAWKVIGHIMGVRPELLPVDVDDAFHLATTIFNRQKGPSEAGRGLTTALLEFMEQQTPGRLFDGFPATIMRHAIDDDVADMLGVPPANWTVVLLRVELGLARLAQRLFDRPGRASWLLERFSEGLVQELVTLERGGNRTLFHIPTGLRAPV
ncbi:MAG: oxygenase MpaB family protein [Candidatus Promineifilaceae bacterium]|nr:oxygenase MpaB family protein [Candidatus Promineifilaceae bacterium]